MDFIRNIPNSIYNKTVVCTTCIHKNVMHPIYQHVYEPAINFIANKAMGSSQESGITAFFVNIQVIYFFGWQAYLYNLIVGISAFVGSLTFIVILLKCSINTNLHQAEIEAQKLMPKVAQESTWRLFKNDERKKLEEFQQAIQTYKKILSYLDPATLYGSIITAVISCSLLGWASVLYQVLPLIACTVPIIQCITLQHQNAVWKLANYVNGWLSTVDSWSTWFSSMKSQAKTGATSSLSFLSSGACQLCSGTYTWWNTPRQYPGDDGPRPNPEADLVSYYTPSGSPVGTPRMGIFQQDHQAPEDEVPATPRAAVRSFVPATPVASSEASVPLDMRTCDSDSDLGDPDDLLDISEPDPIPDLAHLQDLILSSQKRPASCKSPAAGA